jgi:catechol 2,3-dioxygenase-like lactoylglutathione lyase family enzyme
MKRFHAHVSVTNLAESIRFYSALFGAEPTVTKPDYAKWMIDDPRVNFAISARGQAGGVNHLGIQVDTEDELGEMRAAIDRAAMPVVEEREVACCYARSNKHWVTDPQGVAWETYRTLESVPTFGEAASPAACCAPRAEARATPKSGCCA